MTRSLLVSLLALGLLFGCVEDDDACDPDQLLIKNQCVNQPDPATGGSSSGGGALGGQGGEEASGGEAHFAGSESAGGAAPNGLEVYGTKCEVDAQCKSPAPICGKAPGAPSGVCTSTGCNTMGASCPDGWRCLSFADACVAE